MTKIITNIKIVKILYKLPSSNENKPNAIPSFQISLIFKNFEENISDPKNFLSKYMTYILENLSSKKIDKINIESSKKFLFKFFKVIQNVLGK